MLPQDQYASLQAAHTQQQFRISDVQEVSSNYQLQQDENLVSFSEEKLTNHELAQSTVSQRTEMRALQARQVESLLKQVNFNILVAGQSGTGKTTFISTLLEQNCFTDKQVSVMPHSLRVVENSAMLSHKHMKVQLTFIDVEGYKSHAVVREWVTQVKRIISTQFRVHWHKQKLLYSSKDLFQTQHRNLTDDRTHSCLYFINGPRLAQEDLFAIKNLSQIVSVIPIIAKGDSYTKEEQFQIKALIRKGISDYRIECFDCLKGLPDNSKYRPWLLKNEAPPFVMVSQVTKDGEQGRVYPWGVCEVWNPEHSDLQTLQKLLIGHYSLEMIDLTDFFQHRYIKRKHQRKQKRHQQLQQEDSDSPVTDIVKMMFQGVVKFLFN